MNVMLLSPFFFPEPISTGKYNTDLVKELVRKGCNVTVLCSHPIYPKWEVNQSTDLIDGVDIVRGGSKMIYPKSGILRRFFLEVWFAFFVLRNIFIYRNKIDIIIPVFPPSLAFAFIVGLLPDKIKKIGLVHDLQSVFIVNSRGFIKKFISLFIKKVEKFGFNSCDKIILLSNEMKVQVNEEYGINLSKLVVQYPFVNLSNQLTNDLCDVLDSEHKHVVYSGALGEKQNPILLLDFFNYCSSNLVDVKFHIFSSGHIFENLKSGNKNKNIIFHDLVPFKNLRELYVKANAHIIPQKQQTSSGSLPSKLPNLLSVTQNILLVTDYGSEIHKLFDKNNFGEVVTEWENIKLLHALNKILSSEKEDISIKKTNIVNNLFSINSLVEKIL